MRPENLLLLAMLGGLVFLMFNRTRKQQREAQQIQAGLSVGAEVMTTAGLYATVVALDDQTVTLETAPGQRSRWDRRAVARIVDPTASLPPSDDDATDIDEGAGARLEQDGEDGGGPSAGPGTAPPDRA